MRIWELSRKIARFGLCRALEEIEQTELEVGAFLKRGSGGDRRTDTYHAELWKLEAPVRDVFRIYSPIQALTAIEFWQRNP